MNVPQIQMFGKEDAAKGFGKMNSRDDESLSYTFVVDSLI